MKRDGVVFGSKENIGKLFDFPREYQKLITFENYGVTIGCRIEPQGPYSSVTITLNDNTVNKIKCYTSITFCKYAPILEFYIRTRVSRNTLKEFLAKHVKETFYG